MNDDREEMRRGVGAQRAAVRRAAVAGSGAGEGMDGGSQIDTLTPEEREFLRHAEKKHRANLNWFEFEDFAFGMRSPLFSRTRSHLDVLRHPLYLALKEMWLDLGEKQGLVAPSRREEHLARRKTQRSGASAQKRKSAKKRDMETAHSRAHRRSSKSRS
ncbi:MAG TPA: hypothetical protein VNA69_11670 [Thermoanaerobaculia bacterium]|nr:hypothetical protein [Thermoanaerobaculia bacterium]